MKILFDNLLASATLSAGGTSLNYPLSNLLHAFLKKKFQQTVDGSSGMPDADALTLTWLSNQIVDSIFIGYSNATLFTLKLYGSTGTLLYTKTFTDLEMGVSFAAVSGVRSAKLLLDDELGLASMTVYLGGLGIGQSYIMPDPLNDWTLEQIDNSIGDTTLDGQVLGQYIEPLRSYSFNFKIGLRSIYSAVYNKVKALGRYTPVFCAPFEDAMDEVPAMYVVLDGGFKSPSKDDNVFGFALTLLEAR